MPTPSRGRAAGSVLILSMLALGCTHARMGDLPTGALATSPHTPATPVSTTSAVVWPEDGQASYALDGQVLSSPRQRPVPIASVAKVMTAYVTVHRLSASSHVVVDAHDVVDTERRRRRGESVVDVAEGERLDRHQALIALLLPSANNVAVMLAERVAGSRSRFLVLMNQAAQELGMHDTTYTDPSGFASSTVSTARDQLRLLKAAMGSPELALVLSSPSAVLPVVGTVRNTNVLLGQDGFVAGKTGSTSAAGGCLVFRVIRDGRVLDGAVLGQHGGRLIDAGLRSATNLARQAFSA